MVKEKEKLIWLGVKRPSQTQSSAEGEIEKLRDNVGDYSTFQNELDAYDLDGDGTDEDISSFSDFKTYLKDYTFSQQGADDFVTKIQNNFEDTDADGSKYDDFESFVQNDSDSYSELKSAFDSQSSFGTELETEDGQQAAGVRTFENDGVTYDGISVPAGSVEMFGREVHFSQSGTTKSGDGSGSTGGDSVFTVDNFQTDDSDDVVDIYQTITFSADITNNGSYHEFFVASLTEDGDTLNNKNLKIAPGSTRTVEFDVTKDEYFCADYKINTAGPITACWAPSGITK